MVNDGGNVICFSWRYGWFRYRGPKIVFHFCFDFIDILLYILQVRFFPLFVICIAPLVCAQTILDVEQDLFDQNLMKVEGRIRYVTLEQVIDDEAFEIVAYARKGRFPNWVGTLFIFDQDVSKSKVELHSSLTLPENTIYYGFITHGNVSNVILVLPNEIRMIPFQNEQWDFENAKTFMLPGLAKSWAKSTAVPFQPIQKVNDKNQIWVPTHLGYQTFEAQAGSFAKSAFIPLSPKSFYRSSYDLLPFEMSYWFQNVYWHPKIFPGSLDKNTQVLFSPWMDEIDIVYPDNENRLDQHHFKILTERERDNGMHYLINEPTDLNGDGRTDFLVNKFQGVGTSFRSKSYYYMTGEDGTIPKKGRLVPFPKKKIAGAMVRDISNNGKQDFLIVSTVLNVWSMVRALTKKQLLVSFDVYLLKDKQKDYSFKNRTFPVKFFLTLVSRNFLWMASCQRSMEISMVMVILMLCMRPIREN